MSSIGPALPPHLQKTRQQSPHQSPSVKEDDIAGPSKATETEDEADNFGPALPPHLAAKRKAAVAGPSLPPRDRSTSPKRNVGPTLPPHLAAQRGYESESDDDDVGPSIHMASKGPSEGDGVREFLEREARIAKEREASLPVFASYHCLSTSIAGSCETERAETRGVDVGTARECGLC